MEPIPKPLLRRLILTFLAGIGCFAVGLALYFYIQDKPFLLLSALLFLCSCLKTVFLYRLIQSRSYTVLEGICTDNRARPFGKFREILLTDSAGDRHLILAGKDCRVLTGCRYRFYFKNVPCLPAGQNPLLKKALMTDNLLGMECLPDTEAPA